MKQVLRLGKTTNRVTQGQFYSLSDLGYITDDRGGQMKVCLDRPGYWEICVRSPGHLNCKSTLANVDYTKLENRVAAYTIAAAKISDELMNQTKKSTSVEITTVTYINGQRADQLSNDDLVSAIQDEQSKIDTLKNLPEKVRESSAAVKGLIEKHETNILKLVEILDSNHKFH
jgi:uncharacterized protein YeeX (DUF496 family)